MPEPVVATVEATPTQTPTSVLLDMTADQRAEWRATGKFPEPSTEEPAPSTAVEKTAPAGDEPESVSAPGADNKDTEQDKGKPRLKTKEDTERRIAQLEKDGKPELATRIRLEATQKELRELRQKLESIESGKVGKAESTPAQPLPEVERKPALKAPNEPEEPDLAKFTADGKTWDEYQVAQKQYQKDFRKWVQDFADYKAKSAIEMDRQERATADQNRLIAEQNRKIQHDMDTRMAESRKVHADYDEVVGPYRTAIVTAKGASDQINPTMDHLFVAWPTGAELLHYFASNPDEAKRVARLSPGDTAWEMAQISNQLMGMATPKPEAEEEPATPAIRRTTQAPPPPGKVGGKAAATTDPVENALAQKDVGAFLRAENARQGIKR